MTTLSGKYLTVDRQGWKEQDSRSVTFEAQIKELPVYSRCNLLLKDPKDSRDNENEIQAGQNKQLHCMNSFEPSDRKESEIFVQKVKLLKKSDNCCSEGSQNFTVDRNHSLSRDIKRNPLKGSFGTLTAVRGHNSKILREMSVDKSESASGTHLWEAQLLKELEQERQLRLSLERDYNHLLTQALKNRYGRGEEGEGIEQSTYPHLQIPTQAYGSETYCKKGHQDQQPTQRCTIKDYNVLNDSRLGSQVKQLFKSNPHNQYQQQKFVKQCDHSDEQFADHGQSDANQDNRNTKQYLDSEWINNPECPLPNINHPQKHMFESEVQAQFNALLARISQIDHDHQLSQESFKRWVLENDLAHRERQLERTRQENAILRHNQESGNCTPDTRPNRNGNSLLNGFMLFLLGLLFAKSLLC